MEKGYRKIIIPTIYVGAVVLLVIGVILVLSGVNKYVNDNIDYKYTMDNFFERTTSVINTIENKSIIRPYISDTVKIGKYFYDFEGDSVNQESSLVYYQNTYMQNSGVDYINDEDFDIVSIVDGEVVSVEDSEIYGKIVTIKHTDNLISVYSGVTDVLVSAGYKVSQGEIIAMSTKSNLNEYNSSLHFEVYYNNKVIDPENLYTLEIEDFR